MTRRMVLVVAVVLDNNSVNVVRIFEVVDNVLD